MEPIIARGRQVGVYALAKDGKSELGLYIAAGCATGRDLYGGTIDPAVVLYLDWEMTEDDLEERLRDFGHGPDSDLSRLVYCHYPALPPMDTNAGGHALAAEIDAVGADLVIIDTLAKAVEGEENSADTYRRFAQHTGTRLRERACALLRLDQRRSTPTKRVQDCRRILADGIRYRLLCLREHRRRRGIDPGRNELLNELQ